MYEFEGFHNSPVQMNQKNNLLEIEEHMYILDDVEKPNVFRNMFPFPDWSDQSSSESAHKHIEVD